MAGVRIRWRGVARAAAIVVVGLIALRLAPSLLRAPEPPPLGRDVGLPKAKPASKPVRVVRKPRPKVHRRDVPDAPAAKATIGTRTRHRRKFHQQHPNPSPRAHERVAKMKPSPAPEPAPEPVESAPPPAPEYVPPPPPEPVPAPIPKPTPAPASVPGDGSQEFAPH
jgi:hypothetical protein